MLEILRKFNGLQRQEKLLREEHDAIEEIEALLEPEGGKIE